MSDRGVFYVTAPTPDHTAERIIDIIAGNGCLYGDPMHVPGGIEYGIEVQHSELKGILDHLRAGGFVLGGGARP